MMRAARLNPIRITSYNVCYTKLLRYQKARTPLDALETMRKIAGKSIDPTHVAVLTRIMGSYPIGTMVRLTTMEVGIVLGVRNNFV